MVVPRPTNPTFNSLNPKELSRQCYLEFQMLFNRLCELRTALKDQGEEDTMFINIEESKNERIVNLFYQTPKMRLDYSCFRELCFVNKRMQKTRFKRLLVLFCGINSEGKTVIFGVALLQDESQKDLEFAIKSFLNAVKFQPGCFLIERNSVLRKAFETSFLEH